ncbi:hypothetical protein BA895_18225 [Humibacillus sp. DSM 29435]|uniref:hypothetical protein n=1 Tax=Humibacillus sp. DSM 29435 TaxID=1869167 RepID=UPI0008721435|nr:hypothetical protein [Humibacillus sp. DSM 29435]OFE17003.1 hypothetical protein BA895_18225 [Humibacillus sp. DSM 29435]
MTPRPARFVRAALLTAALVLAGCGTGEQPSSDGGSSSSQPTTTTTTTTTTTAAAGPTPSAGTDAGTTLPGGEVTSRSGSYRVTAPAGWGEATDQAGTGISGLDLVLLSSKKVSKFSNNLVIITTSGDAAVVEKELDKGRSQMASADREVGDADDVQIAGVTAKGFTTKFEQKGVRITARSYAMARDGKVYLLTLSSSQDDAASALRAFGEITDSWKWL